MAQVNEKIDEITVPDGGIGNFIMDDAEIEAAYGDDNNGMEESRGEGIAQFPALTKQMAAMGREGDDIIAHLQTGELVIPLALIEQDDALKESIFQRLRNMGVEDPERYVVGSDANSINPETGAPEFFLGKLLKGIAKSVKKVAKSVVKVIKKVAPVVLPIVGTVFLGPVYGAALGSGIATLINGGNMKDAFKSALVSGVTGAVTAGVSGAMSGAGFGAGVKAAMNPANITAGFGALKTGFTEGFGQSGIGFNSMKYGIAGGEQISATLADKAAQAAATQAAITPEQVLSYDGVPVRPEQVVSYDGVPVTPEQVMSQAQGLGGVEAYQPPGFVENIKGAFTPGDEIGFGEGLKEAFFPTGPDAAQVQMAKTSAYNDAYNAVAAMPGTTTSQAAAAGLNAMKETTAASLRPGFLRTYGPMAALGTGLAASAGAFKLPEQEELDIAMRDESGNVVTGEDLVAANPSMYLVGDLGSQVLDPNTGTYVSQSSTSIGPPSDLTLQASTYPNYQVPTQYALRNGQTYLASSTPGGPFARPYVTQAAEGGAIFPRRNGGIMPNEGIPGQDSVRAMLMPGEFVMTTEAVRGMGNGNLNNGIKNMYSVMRNLERRGRAMA